MAFMHHHMKNNINNRKLVSEYHLEDELWPHEMLIDAAGSYSEAEEKEGEEYDEENN